MRDLSDFCLIGRLPIFIDNFLSNRNFKVRVGTTLSGLQGQEEGVPQGSILSVTLFSMKINNIVKALNPGVDCSLYVDDFLICYRSKHIHTIERQLQQCLNKIQFLLIIFYQIEMLKFVSEPLFLVWRRVFHRAAFYLLHCLELRS